jgi:predicted phage terminase large subunit-like protein
MPAVADRPKKKAQPDKVATNKNKLMASVCRASFVDFVRRFWSEVPGAGKLAWNWHMDFLCTELQGVAERVFREEEKLHDEVFNVSPGTSKSTICSILFPAWIWTRMPHARIMTASHTEALVLDLANKARAVIKSTKYQECFPEIELRDDQASKGYYINTAGGDRYTCTVAGKSPMGFHAHFIIVDDPIDPKKVLSEVEVKTASEFMTDVISTRKVDKAVTVTFLIMQRLGVGDPTEVMLEAAKKDGAAKVRHVCLPAEIDPHEEELIQPPELVKYYIDGLMDPKRLGRKVLKEFQAKGAHFYSTQFKQRPYAKEGGMFEEQWFNNRVKAAPYNARRVRYADRAATESGGCNTASVLMSEADGKYFVENCEAGQWGPDKRNAKLRAFALRDRSRYPKKEPDQWIEAEGGSSGRDSWLGVARALAGFNVREDKVTGNKVTRAEPWAAQLAAGNVFIVDDGTWDVEAYIKEHCAFPLGGFLDRVDASSGAFNILVGKKPVTGSFRVLTTKGKQLITRMVICSRQELSNLVIEDHPCLLVSCQEPGENTTPLHGLHKLLDTCVLNFADINPANHQDTWEEILPDYNLPVKDVIMTSEHGRALWKFLLKEREVKPEVFVFQDEGDERARALAVAVCEAMRLPKETAIYDCEGTDNQCKGPQNSHVYDMTKLARGLMVK